MMNARVRKAPLLESGGDLVGGDHLKAVVVNAEMIMNRPRRKRASMSSKGDRARVAEDEGHDPIQSTIVFVSMSRKNGSGRPFHTSA